MLDSETKNQIKDILSGMTEPVTLHVTGATGSAATDGMLDFAHDVASASRWLSVTYADAASSERQPALSLMRGGRPVGITFCGIPGGHEFSSLLLAVLNAVGLGKNLPDQAVARRIKAIAEPVELVTFVSLTCTNCPDVVQALNVMALCNPKITHTVVDGGEFPELVARYAVQSVPSVYANGKLLSVGRSDLGRLLGHVEQEFGLSDVAVDGLSVGEPRSYDVVVVGSGPAGAAAAIYSARKGLKTAVVAGRIGGQVKDTMDIENLISVPKTTGPALAADLRLHMERYGIDLFENRDISSVAVDGVSKVITAGGGEVFRAPAVIVATGASWRRLNVDGEDEYIGRGVAFCSHCDGPFFAGKRVAVVGGGNSGIEAAIDLAGICEHVDVFEFLDALRADDVLQERLRQFGNVKVHVSSAVREVLGDGKSVTGLRVQDRKSEAETVYEVSGVFVQIGLTPNSSLFAGSLSVNGRGEIETDASGRTSVTGVYAAGDVTDVPYKQIVIAMGEGAKAALAMVDDRMRGIIGGRDHRVGLNP